MFAEVKIRDEGEPRHCDCVAALLVFRPGVDAETVQRELRGLMSQGALSALEMANVYRYNGERGSPAFHVL